MNKKLLLFRKRSALRRRRHLRQLKIVSKHPFIVPVVTFLILGLVTAAGFFIWSALRTEPIPARVVIISHDGGQEVVPAHQTTVGDLLSKLHIVLNQGDVVEPALSTMIDQDQFRINVYRARPVEVIDNGQPTFTYSAATTSRSIAQQAGKTTYAEDIVAAAPVNNFVTQHAIGQQVTIKRATPVNVNLYGTSTVIRTQAKTVGDLLKEKGIKLAAQDQLLPAEVTPITPNLQVFIVREGTKLATETQTISMPVQTVLDNNLAYGTTAVRQQGAAGQQVVTYQIHLQNGVEVGRDIIQTVITSDPITQIVAQGTNLGGIKGDMATAGIAMADYTYADYIISHESGWNPQASNARSGAYGLCQALPGSNMASAGSDWATNPVTQLRWCNNYALSPRYGGWQQAYNFWRNNGWW